MFVEILRTSKMQTRCHVHASISQSRLYHLYSLMRGAKPCVLAGVKLLGTRQATAENPDETLVTAKAGGIFMS